MLDGRTRLKIRNSIKNPPNLENYSAANLNCYAYSLGITYYDVYDAAIRYYPGLLSSDVNYNNSNHPRTYYEYFHCIQRDCNYLDIECMPFNMSKQQLKKNQYLIAIYHHNNTSNKDGTYAHFMRFDHSLGWSHKQGWHKAPTTVEQLTPKIILDIDCLYHLLGFIVVSY